MPTRPTGRLFSADALKAAAIVGVVFIHADGIFQVPSVFHAVVADMFRFGVPVFIALYVHFACNGMERRGDIVGYSRGRFVRLFTQFVFWSVVYCLLTVQWQGLTPLKLFTRHWAGNGWPGQFYFIVALQLAWLMPWLSRSGQWFAKHRALLLGGGLVFYTALAYTDAHVAPVVPRLNDRPFWYWLPYAWLGIAWVGHRPPLSNRVAWCAALVGIALIPIEHRLIHPPNPVDSVYLMPSVFLASVALLGLIGQQARPNSVFVLPSRLRGVVSVLSANTLGIFVLNPMMILLAHALLPTRPAASGLWSDIALPLVAASIALSASLAASSLLKRSDAGRRLLA